MTDAELAHTKELAFWMTERVFMNPISAKFLNEDWRKAFPDEVAVAERMIALVEALEKAQGMETYWKTQCRGITDHCEELQARIAELESRTVKLPQRLQPGADGYDDWYVHSDDDGEYLKVDDVLAMLTAAGIKVEAE
ncbi:TPA: hypothetical protein QHK25_000180 [Klebsiella quasipneumoniae subsp. similipneumoniae]|nr:hypothetical protein [Klebsiella quasipneumoniae subsp. similipneumoniae]